jgi:hypothetical protein
MPTVGLFALGLAILVALGVAWLWTSRIRVSPKRVPLMTHRIAFPGGLRLHEPELALARLDEPEEIVIPHEHATLVIAYPLSSPASVRISAPIPHGFTRAELVRTICEEYANVYDAEEGTAATTTVPRDERGDRKGRNRTDGAYGIWGYDLQDLVLTAVRWTRKPDGSVTIDLHVESWGLRLTTET